MVPYLHSPGFMLACGSTLHFFNITSGSVVSHIVETHPDTGSGLEPRNPEMFQKFPAFTAYAHCFRGQSYRQKRMEIFNLLREDGILLSIEIDSLSGLSGHIFRVAAKLQCYGSEALTSFLTTGTLSDPDRLALAGDMSDGRLISIGDTWSVLRRQDAMAPQMLQRLPNWSPVLDIALISPKYGDDDVYQTGSLFMTSSRQPYASIAQVRSGCKAVVSVTVPIPGLEDLGHATGIWTVMDETSGGLYFFISFVTYTLILSGSIHDLSVAELSCQTLAVSQEDGFILHVSSEKVRLFTAEGLRLEPTTAAAELDYSSSGQILAAASIPMNAAAIIVRRDGTHEISIGLHTGVSDNSAATGHNISIIGQEIHDLEYTPTAVSVFEKQGRYFAVVGTSNGELIVLAISDSQGLSEVGRFSWTDSKSTPQESVVESVGILGDGISSEFVILCGLRGGSLRYVDFSLSLSDTATIGFSKHRVKALSFGTHPVTLHTDGINTHTVAFATCGSTIMRISASATSRGKLEFQNVWFNDENEDKPGFKQPRHPVLAMVPTMVKRSRAPEEVAIFSPAGLFLAIMDQQSDFVGLRRIPLSLRLDHMDIKVEKDQSSVFMEAGTPQKLLYLAAHDVLVVATKQMELVLPPSHAQEPSWAGKRSWKMSLIFIPMTTPRRDEDPSWKPFYSDPRDYSVLSLGAFEQVLCMCEWEWIVNGDDGPVTRKQVLVSTSVTGFGDAKEGKLYFLNVHRDKKGFTACVVANVKSPPRPIKAMAAFSATRLVVCDSESLEVYGFDWVDK
jgi:hypothetical protein